MQSSPPEFISDTDLARAKAGILDEIIRQGEARLQVQLQAALAADARAGVLASVQGAGSAALFVLAFQNSTNPNGVWAAIPAAIALAIGCGLATRALKPVDFGFIGTRPHDWKGDLVNGTDFDQARRDTARHLDRFLVHNDKVMGTNNKFATWSLRALASGPVLAAAGLGLYAFLHR